MKVIRTFSHKKKKKRPLKKERERQKNSKVVCFFFCAPLIALKYRAWNNNYFFFISNLDHLLACSLALFLEKLTPMFLCNNTFFSHCLIYRKSMVTWSEIKWMQGFRQRHVSKTKGSRRMAFFQSARMLELLFWSEPKQIWSHSFDFSGH